jgi:hypothetical protein
MKVVAWDGGNSEECPVKRSSPSNRQSQSPFAARAALCSWCAEQTASAEAAAAFLYLEQMWILVAELAEIVEEHRSWSPLGSDPHHL